MPALKYKVELNESERTQLKEIANRGETSARKVKRALVLLRQIPTVISPADYRTHGGTCAHAVCEEGLDSALNERTGTEAQAER